ncbi:acyl-phosphate glycerol 3-phosphate acyltransferase [Candidatus Epulonipiscium fishelsonii]|uniref:Acyl-phosphate glycerol 3-phosphate acyltransferase n=1 Tax=Candidatus Epulonipiscium fishelsonii TaxID=77094 RepID=A0ACC8XDU5_9FIRM|nr:acyl-phosphate glycerol 3-phosphate acyltransferase [Epulopiscium sp. SCG-B05WGA-EpuloA1]ONI40958.1 acyl-phosphate glycerol 3-phosphate acyltransferase [Epulopiscium sp. SCG-B11WGA-EpuloA1]
MYRIISLLLGYLFGGIQTAVMYSKLKGVDIRNEGSGNPGTTNVWRVLGKEAGITVFLGELAKSMIPVMTSKLLFKKNKVIAALYTTIGTILGHSYPLYSKFKGGKGVAVTVGSIYMVNFPLGMITSVLFFTSLAITRMVSFSSMVMTGSIPFLLAKFFKGKPYTKEAVTLGTLVSLITSYRHEANIKRIIAGTEPKLKKKLK